MPLGSASSSFTCMIRAMQNRWVQHSAWWELPSRDMAGRYAISFPTAIPPRESVLRVSEISEKFYVELILSLTTRQSYYVHVWLCLTTEKRWWKMLELYEHECLMQIRGLHCIGFFAFLQWQRMTGAVLASLRISDCLGLRTAQKADSTTEKKAWP